MSDAAYATACRYSWQDAAALMERALQAAIDRSREPHRHRRLNRRFGGGAQQRDCSECSELQGNIFAPIALFGLHPVLLCSFFFLPPRKAVIYGFMIAWLFLPMSHLPLHGFTDLQQNVRGLRGYPRRGILFRQSHRLLVPAQRSGTSPCSSGASARSFHPICNGYGPYDGFSGIAYQTTTWGLPYFIGRIYFNDLKGLRELAIGIVVGGLLYVPLSGTKSA